MKSKVKKLDGTAVQFEVEMPKETVDQVIEEVLQDIGKTAKIDGFRPGKAPLDIIRKAYHKDAVDEMKQRLLPSAYQEALNKHEINPVSYPEVSEVVISPAGTLSFKATVDTHPEVNVKKYKGIKVTVQKVKVTDEEVEEAIERVRNMNAEFIDIAGPLARGNFGICDVETRIGGEVISKKRENMWIEVDKDASLLGMGEKLEGMKKGDSRDIDVTLPENYPDGKYAGKEAVFSVTVKETKEKKLPGIDDELAGKMGKDNLADARADIRTQLLEMKESNMRVSMKNQIMQELLDKCPFKVPGTMVAKQLKVLMDKARTDLLSKGVDEKAIAEHSAKLEEQLGKDAENKVRLYFILDKVGDLENVEVSDEEVDTWLGALAANYNQSLDSVKKYYEEHDLIGGLREQLREDKTLDFLVSEATVTEKNKA
jgi:trigger factor